MFCIPPRLEELTEDELLSLLGKEISVEMFGENYSGKLWKDSYIKEFKFLTRDHPYAKASGAIAQMSEIYPKGTPPEKDFPSIANDGRLCKRNGELVYKTNKTEGVWFWHAPSSDYFQRARYLSQEVLF